MYWHSVLFKSSLSALSVFPSLSSRPAFEMESRPTGQETCHPEDLLKGPLMIPLSGLMVPSVAVWRSGSPLSSVPRQAGTRRDVPQVQPYPGCQVAAEAVPSGCVVCRTAGDVISAEVTSFPGARRG